MSELKQKLAAEKFAKHWEGKGYEKGESQKFWLSLLRDVYGIEDVDDFISFEDKVKLDNTSFIDGRILSSSVLIEQKSVDKDLGKPYLQSDGKLQTPLEQAKKYIVELPRSEHPKWVVLCNFKEFHVYDMDRPEKKEPEIIYLKDLGKEYSRLSFLVNNNASNVRKQLDISRTASERIGEIYDAFLAEYVDKDSDHVLKSLNILCVRLVFCFYAEDAGVFPKKNQFHDYLIQYSSKDSRRALIDLFKVLDQKYDERDKYLIPELANFPYVNGGLFEDEDIEIPNFTDSIRELILKKSSEEFDWSEIDPTIFGTLFESTLNPETRHDGGMHYTSLENIHKVIDNLYLNSLKEELKQITAVSNETMRNKQLDLFREKLSKIYVLDPACGSGNFLTETYLSFRRLENEVLKLQQKNGQVVFDVDGVIRVSINQFYGIECNDFAVNVAKTALWIAEYQMMQETEKIVAFDLNFLPLKTNANIREGNALKTDWESVVSKDKLTYIIGNPPFLGASEMSAEQKKDAVDVFGKIKLSNSIDYVGAWYILAAKYIQGTNIKVAFVSTNSITQGEQVAPLWRELIEKYKIEIIFAYRTFIWNSKAKGVAKVHCVIIGFDAIKENPQLKYIITEQNEKKFANIINPYLVNAPVVYVASRGKPLSAPCYAIRGSQPTDDGNFILKNEAERQELITKEPEIEPYIKKYIDAYDYIRGKERYCLWLKNAKPEIIAKCPSVKKRIEKIKLFRENSTSETTRAKAKEPWFFFQNSHPDTSYLCIPNNTSKNRRYLPMAFMDENTVSSNSNTLVPKATTYHFGILSSCVHMAWLRTVGGRLKSDYRYSGQVVFNTFVWPNPTPEQKSAIENAAQGILDVREKYSESNLLVLYDPITMPSDLLKAHEKLDTEVKKAYGIKGDDEYEIVEFLMKEYQKLV